MNTRLFRPARVATVAALGLLLAAAASAHTTQAPELRQVGRTAIVYRGPDIDVALSYRFAKANPDSKWLFLDVEMTSAGDPIELHRSAVAVRTPDGTIVPLASQGAFNAAYPQLAASVARATVTGEPIGYLLPHRTERLGFFTLPGDGLVFPSVWLDWERNLVGRLYFQVPGGVRPGTYALLISLPEGTVEIPFVV
jgi:hypothetical protein